MWLPFRQRCHSASDTILQTKVRRPHPHLHQTNVPTASEQPRTSPATNHEARGSHDPLQAPEPILQLVQISTRTNYCQKKHEPPHSTSPHASLSPLVRSK